MEIHRTKGMGTFIVKILDQRNATWQGSITWVERNQTACFRSTLELLKLIDSTMETECEGWDVEDEMEID